MAEWRDGFCQSCTVGLHSELKKRGGKRKWMVEYNYLRWSWEVPLSTGNNLTLD